MTSIAAAAGRRIDADANAAEEVVVSRTADEAAMHAGAWDELAGAAGEANSFCESWFVLASLRHLKSGDVRIAFIYERDAANRRVLNGVYPLRATGRYRGLPIRCWTAWRHDYSFLGAPLVRPGREKESLRALIRTLRVMHDGGRLIEFGMLPADGRFRRAIDEWALESRQPLLVTDRHQRALLHVPARYDEYFQATFDRKRRKEFVRQGNRLRDAGPVETVCLSPREDAGTWIDAFLELESSGWKGRDGTALAARDSDRAFLREAAIEAHRRGRLMLLALRVGGRTIAMKVNWMAGEGGFAFKIAYDEAWSAYSPGLLLELANVEHLAHAGKTRWMDSCADAGHFMANRIWPGRRSIETVVVPLRAGGTWIVRLLRLVQYAKNLRKTKSAGGAIAAPATEGVAT